MAKTRNFEEAIRNKLQNNPELAEAVDDESFNAHIATEIYEARKSAGLTQKKLAELIGTQQSVIARLEDADYGSHSVSMLRRIAKAVGKRLRISFDSDSDVLNDDPTSDAASHADTTVAGGGTAISGLQPGTSDPRIA